MLKKLILQIVLFLTVTISYGQVPSYYNGLDLSKTGSALFLELSTRITNTHSALPYTSGSTDTWDVLMLADEDPNNNLNVLLIYGFDDNDGDSSTDRSRLKTATDTGGGDAGKWNREHVFAKSLANPSLGTDSPGPGTDVHNLRAADATRNGTRSNRKFADGSGDSQIIIDNGGWYPGDEWKGDVARIVMYMYLRYNGDGSMVSQTQCLPVDVGFGNPLQEDVNMLDVFLKWNVEDPVSQFEIDRNIEIEKEQGNRNPFIDNPYLATLIWGGLTAEDTWNLNNSSDTEAPTIPGNVQVVDKTFNSIEIHWEASTDNESVFDYLIYVNGEYTQYATELTATITGLEAETTYDITIRARDTSSNLSESSTVLQVTTEELPNYLILENFEDCDNLKFFFYNEESNKNWACQNSFGENNSGSAAINGYQQDVLSKDWMITSQPLQMDFSTGETLSFYTDAAYGNSSLELVYSSDYDGTGNPGDFTWVAVPNVTIPTHTDGSGNEEVYTFENVDISSIAGSIYMAFRYYSNQDPTRWTVDSFSIIAETVNEDIDNDGVLNENDLCPNTEEGLTVDENGCANNQLDDDNDGVLNPSDDCPNTAEGAIVDAAGCAIFNLPYDNFTIETIGETCADKNNGSIQISATETHNYTATINSTEHAFSENLEVTNLEPGTYELCITVEGESYEQCFDLVIEEGGELSGKVGLQSEKVTVTIEEGTAPFTVYLNETKLMTTSKPSFDLDVVHGDLVQVKSAVECEGVLEKLIQYLDGIIVYPNPTYNTVEVALPVQVNEAPIKVFDLSGRLLLNRNYQNNSGKIKVDISGLSKGYYLLKIELDDPIVKKILKQ